MVLSPKRRHVCEQQVQGKWSSLYSMPVPSMSLFCISRKTQVFTRADDTLLSFACLMLKGRATGRVLFVGFVVCVVA